MLLKLLCAAVMLDSAAKVADLQVLDSGLNPVQQPLQLCGPLRLLSHLTNVLLNTALKIDTENVQSQNTHALSSPASSFSRWWGLDAWHPVVGQSQCSQQVRVEAVTAVD